jgi:hypothetical protein
MKITALVTSILATTLLGGALGACGGGKASGETTPSTGEATPSDSNGTVVSSETMDDVRRALDRKRNVVARCLTPAIDAGELPKNARGRMTLELVITPGGKATDIKVIKTSIDSKTVADCVIARVGEIEFPAVAEPLPWSYTYGFEAM